MRTVLVATLVLMAVAASPAPAQHGGHQASPAAPAAGTQPYAGMAQRRVKALSEVQEADLRAGRGMGLALAAELNGYPGPAHVLEHADALALTPAQRAAVQALRDRMTAEAQTIGTRIMLTEEAMDAMFAGGSAEAGQLAALSASIGALGGRLREAHLVAHIGTRDALESGQRDAYARLRGYAASR